MQDTWIGTEEETDNQHTIAAANRQISVSVLKILRQIGDMSLVSEL